MKTTRLGINNNPIRIYGRSRGKQQAFLHQSTGRSSTHRRIKFARLRINYDRNIDEVFYWVILGPILLTDRFKPEDYNSDLRNRGAPGTCGWIYTGTHNFLVHPEIKCICNFFNWREKWIDSQQPIMLCW